MTGEVMSFKIDHTRLEPGIYVHDVKEVNGHKVTTYDIRFYKPNDGVYLTPCQAHTIEHVCATYFTENMPEKLYFGDMACLTGFYLVVDGEHDLDFILKHISSLDDYWRDLLVDQKVPAKSPLRCGNYKLLDINEGFKAWNRFYLLRDRWGTEYPLIDENACSYPEDYYQSEFEYEVRTK